MPKLTKVSALKPLNKSLQYPNFYWLLHEGIADAAVTDIVCQSTGLTLTVNAPGATQWGATLGNNEPALNNTTQRINTLDVSAHADEFDAVVANLNTGAWMICFNCDYVRDDAASETLFSIRDQIANVNVFEIRMNPRVGDVQHTFLDSGGTNRIQGIEVTNALGEQFVVMYFDMRAGIKTSTVYMMTPGTKINNKIISTTLDITGAAFTIPSSAAGAGMITINARQIGASSFDKYNDVCGIRDLRMINFGLNPPTDIADLIDELAVNSNTGTRREY